MLTAVDVKIIQTEASFVKDHCPVVNELLLLVEGSTYPMAHYLHPKLKEIKSAFSILAKSKRVTYDLGEKSKSLIVSLSYEKKNNLEDRIKNVSKQIVF